MKTIKNKTIESIIYQYLQREEVCEILINGHNEVWVEGNDGLERVEERFPSEIELQRTARNFLSNIGRKIDFKNPYADARLADGSRICVVIPPASLSGTHINIRKFNKRHSSLKELAKSNSTISKNLPAINKAIQEKGNILISGATGAGKTTLLNAIASEVSPKERIITLEDTAELFIKHPHVVRLESRPPNSEGEGEVTLRKLLQTALRMRPDRIIIGECRGAESLDLLLALNTGHDGSMATIHANSARDALSRLELLCALNAVNLPPPLIRSYIYASIHILIHLTRHKQQRNIHSIQKLCGLEEGVFLLRNLT